MLGDMRDLIAHVELESYPALTRMPQMSQPFRAEPSIVARYLREDFPGARIVLGDAGCGDGLQDCLSPAVRL